jgi:hypothetical protein
MKKQILAAAFGLIILGTTPARAESYPILDSYQALATQLVDLARDARTADDVATVVTRTRELVVQGEAIMRLYAEKNPICAEQFAVMLPEIPQAESMSVDELHSRYHDGVGLPKAPRHCYLGRSQVVHPLMNIVRLRGELTDAVRAKIVDEYAEVVEHVAKIRVNLEHPPK